jgi:hypothetical protein
MKLIKYFAIILTVVFLASCKATMKVEMKILDRNFLLNSPNYWFEKLRPIENKIRYNLLNGEYESLRDKAKRESRESIQEIVDKLNEARKNKIHQQVSAQYAQKKNALSDSIKVLDNLAKQKIPAAQKKKLVQQSKQLKGELDSVKKTEPENISQDKAKLAADVIIPEPTKNQLIEAIEKVINDEIDAVRNSHTEALNKSDNAKLWPPCKPKGNEEIDTCRIRMLIVDNLRGSYTLATMGFVKLNSLGPYLAAELNKLRAFVSVENNPGLKTYTDPNITSILDELSSDVKKSTQPLTNTVSLNSIQNDPLASIVAGADTSYWKAITNEAFANTDIGNSDIAFVTQPNGEYSIKGVRNDASNVTKATFQFFNFTVEALARYSGVILPSNSQNDSGSDTLATTSGKLIHANSEVKVLKTNSQSAKIRIFQSIINQEANLNDPLKREAAINTIKTVFNASKKTLLNE